MSSRVSTRYWLALSGVATLAMAAALWADYQTAWAVTVLVIMGVVTIAGGIAQTRLER